MRLALFILMTSCFAVPLYFTHHQDAQTECRDYHEKMQACRHLHTVKCIALRKLVAVDPIACY